jgi:hypothetical protein
VTAASNDGQTAQASIHYTVLARPPAMSVIETIRSSHQTAAFAFHPTGSTTGIRFECALIKRKNGKYPKPSFSACTSPLPTSI